MIVRHHHAGKVYVIDVPPGSHVRHSELAGESVLYVPTEGGEVPLFEQPPTLLVQLAREGRHGLRLIGVEDEPES